MKKYFIEIDLKTIQKNPNAGNTITYYPGCKKVTFEAKELPPFFIEGVNCIITEWGIVYNDDGSEKKVNCSGVFIGNPTELVQRCMNEGVPGLIFSLNQDHIRINSLTPESDYFYKYKNKKVQCYSCKSSFDHTNLKSGSDYDDDDFYIANNTICPVCGTWDCCEVEYETIESALKRKGVV